MSQVLTSLGGTDSACSKPIPSKLDLLVPLCLQQCSSLWILTFVPVAAVSQFLQSLCSKLSLHQFTCWEFFLSVHTLQNACRCFFEFSLVCRLPISLTCTATVGYRSGNSWVLDLILEWKRIYNNNGHNASTQLVKLIKGLGFLFCDCLFLSFMHSVTQSTNLYLLCIRHGNR